MESRGLKVLLFAGLAESVGAREVEVDWAAGTAAELRQLLQQRYPAAAALLARSAVAVGEQYCRDGDAVLAGSEVALLPPVSGG